MGAFWSKGRKAKGLAGDFILSADSPGGFHPFRISHAAGLFSASCLGDLNIILDGLTELEDKGCGDH